MNAQEYYDAVLKEVKKTYPTQEDLPQGYVEDCQRAELPPEMAAKSYVESVTVDDEDAD